MIPEEEIVRLAECYDRYANALDPTSRERKQAKLSFFANDGAAAPKAWPDH